MKFRDLYVENSCHTLPVFATVDVLVAGGGAAGIAAAETAARSGNSVLLVEKYGFLGGAAVAGLSGTICGLFLASDVNSRPEQIVYGFTDKFYRELAKMDGVTAPQKYGKTWTVTHDSLVWREVAENLLEAAGANILYHSNIVGVIKDDRDYKGIVIDTKSGVAAIHAKVIIDATGDADLIYRSGYDYVMGDNGHIQNPTMIFRLGGVDVQAFLQEWGDDTISPAKITKQIEAACENDGYDLPRKKIWIFSTPRPNELLVNATRIVGRDGRELNVMLPRDHTEAEIVGRRQARAYASFLKKYVAGCENSFIDDTGVEVGVRQTRSIVGVACLTNQDVISHRKRTDGIAKCPWPIELHSGEKPKVEWIVDDYYEIPFGALVPVKGENILIAGRSLSAEHEAMASARVTAQCFQYGQAAGIAAGLAIKSNRAIRALAGEEIRFLMNKDNARME
ncbi:FAD-dependent oxidoreductase [Sporomusa termitida]|uniref:FAD dependent oxidoreductase n=1 Tax=Sporomusa termitida TaxID=2377 RepID=A0A517DV43_9FIRM|nr:FAD-dependent oxidoreductase [Sporomusa termitida]QDR81234.1 FAD dependent oxidoreductase [Sporomusa termitida]